MGCDIHSWLERREGGRWVYATRLSDDPDQEIDAYNERRYSTFAVLAGVRNYDELQPIRTPRGLPPDVSPEGTKRAAEWADDAHSHGWFSLRELLDFDWTRHFVSSDMCTFDEARERFCAETLAQSQCFVRPDSDRVHYPKLTSYAEACDYFLSTVIPTMAALGAPDNVRIVFHFDN
ncbi:MAG: hypothetical protein HY901_21600 [Deltaproteobacteria bacterium]|nr:hypothetical protein [Deltaproteobacteria bacterium]